MWCRTDSSTASEGLDLDRTAHDIHNTCELCQEAVASIFDNAPAVLRDIGINQLPEMGFQALVRAFLVRAHQP